MLKKINSLNQEKNNLLKKLDNRLLFNKIFKIANSENSIFIGSFLLISNNRIKSKIVYLTCRNDNGKIEVLKFKIKDFKNILPDLKIQELHKSPEAYKNKIENLKFFNIEGVL